MNITTAAAAYQYALSITKGRVPHLEKIILEECVYSYFYARDIIQGRWPEAEQIIAGSDVYSYYYSAHVIRERFPAGEAMIATNEYYSYAYSISVIEGRWPEAEELILNSLYSLEYFQSLSINDMIDIMDISDDEVLILKLKYSEEDLRNYLLKSDHRFK